MRKIFAHWHRSGLILWLLCPAFCLAQGNPGVSFVVSIPDPAESFFQVTMEYEPAGDSVIDFQMPVWTPGYYQIMPYADEVKNFSATTPSGDTLSWTKRSPHTWRISAAGKPVVLHYNVLARKAFVANPFVDSTRAYLLPAGVFLFPKGHLNIPVTLRLIPAKYWSDAATGLVSVQGKPFTYTASDFNVLYDSPILMGNLETLPSFTVDHIPHYFTGYRLGQFDREQFMADLKKIVKAGIAIIGDIPYKDYTFIAIGPGRGGIEHANSSTISFSGDGLDHREARLAMYSFIAHEFFHLYNIKRIRPVELGPFDYEHANRTRMLWVSEGLTVYYEYLILRRAGLSSRKELLQAFREQIKTLQSNPGRHYQSLTEASWETWSDGPFGNNKNKPGQTISYYNKGPVVGMLLDFAIRHATDNKKSLDDAMRFLYHEYYQGSQRGFTEKEFWTACEDIAGTSLTELKDYTTTVKEIDYAKYLSYAGLNADLSPIADPDSLQQSILTNWSRRDE